MISLHWRIGPDLQGNMNPDPRGLIHTVQEDVSQPGWKKPDGPACTSHLSPDSNQASHRSGASWTPPVPASQQGQLPGWAGKKRLLHVG